MHLEQIRCVDIHPDSRTAGYQPHEIEVLADSVRRHGVLRPVLLRETADGYLIVHGERRWRAALMVGLEVIPAYLVQDFGQSEGVVALTATQAAYEMAAIDD
jgi:ParB family chromosome partitioning protein